MNILFQIMDEYNLKFNKEIEECVIREKEGKRHPILEEFSINDEYYNIPNRSAISYHSISPVSGAENMEKEIGSWHSSIANFSMEDEMKLKIDPSSFTHLKNETPEQSSHNGREWIHERYSIEKNFHFQNEEIAEDFDKFRGENFPEIFKMKPTDSNSDNSCRVDSMIGSYTTPEQSVSAFPFGHFDYEFENLNYHVNQLTDEIIHGLEIESLQESPEIFFDIQNTNASEFNLLGSSLRKGEDLFDLVNIRGESNNLSTSFDAFDGNSSNENCHLTGWNPQDRLLGHLSPDVISKLLTQNPPENSEASAQEQSQIKSCNQIGNQPNDRRTHVQVKRECFVSDLNEPTQASKKKCIDDRNNKLVIDNVSTSTFSSAFKYDNRKGFAGKVAILRPLVAPNVLKGDISTVLGVTYKYLNRMHKGLKHKIGIDQNGTITLKNDYDSRFHTDGFNQPLLPGPTKLCIVPSSLVCLALKQKLNS